MAHPKGKKDAGRANVLAAAGRGFRASGYSGIGVDGLAKEAGVTSGAFYAHFRSKTDAFREAIVAGMTELRVGIEGNRAALGKDWAQDFVEFYMGDRRTCDLSDSCALQSLTTEIARADVAAREAYQAGLESVIVAVSDGLSEEDGDRRAKAIALLALLSGGVSLARAVNDPALAEEIADAVRSVASGLVRTDHRQNASHV